MPMFMDVHPGMGDATAEDVAAAHRRDLEVQDGGFADPVRLYEIVGCT